MRAVIKNDRFDGCVAEQIRAEQEVGACQLPHGCREFWRDPRELLHEFARIDFLRTTPVRIDLGPHYPPLSATVNPCCVQNDTASVRQCPVRSWSVGSPLLNPDILITDYPKR